MRHTTIVSLLCSVAFAALPVFATSASNNATIEAFLPERLYPELKTIIDSVETNAPLLQQHSFYTDEANERYEQAKAARYLNARLVAHVGPRKEYYQSGDSEDNSSFATSAGINLYRPLYHWGAIEAGIKKARLGNEAAEMEFTRKRSDLIRNLRADYLNLHLTEQAHRQEVQKQALTDERIKRAEVQHQSGKISDIELRSIHLEKEESLLSMERMNSRRELILKRFKNNYGWTRPIKIEGTIPEIQVKQALNWLTQEKESLSQSSVYQLYPIQLQMNALRSHKEQQTIIDSYNRPLVNLYLSGMQGKTNTSTDDDVDTFTLSGGINVSWNIFDGFRNKHQRLEAKIKQRRMEAQMQKSAGDLLIEQRRILNSLSLQFRELSILEQQHEIQRERHTEAETKLAAGRITQPQLQSSALKLEELQHKLYQSRASVLMGISDYKEFTRLTTPAS